MKEILLQFENELRNIDAPILKYFNEGLSKEKITTIFSELHLKPTEEVIELFQWKNGTIFEDIPSGKINFGVNGCLLALEELRHSYLFAMIDKLYPKVFFPILTSDDFLINLDESSKDYKKIFIYCPSLIINKPMICFDSLPRMFETFTEGFKQKALWYNQAEYLEYDDDKYNSIAHKMNPNSTFWKKILGK